MEKVKLSDICSPKQWKTIPTSDLLDEGYPVYGANGIIGYYSEYNHEHPVVVVTCRGATCGSINITVPKAYVTGNAMCLDNVRSDIDMNYLYYCLKHYDFNSIISGSAQPQITRQGMNKIYISICSNAEQIEIVDKLRKIEKVISLRKQELQSLDDLIKARFIEMFGDPQLNPMLFEIKQLKDTCNVITGNTPSRKKAEYYGDFIEWIKTDNINPDLIYPTKAAESLSSIGVKKAKTVDKNAILMACIAGSTSSIGKVCITNRKVAFNQQINAIVPFHYNVIFLYVMFQLSKDYLIDGLSMSLKGILSKSKLEAKCFILPPIELQNEFAEFVKLIDKSKVAVQKALDETQMLFDSLMQEYFG